MLSPEHPIWMLAKAGVLFAFCWLFAFLNASEFDETEVWMLTQIGVVLFGGTAIESLVRAAKK